MKVFFFMLLLSFPAFAQAYIRVVPGEIRGFEQYPQEAKFLSEAFIVMEYVLNSEIFKERVISFEGKGDKGGFTQNRSLTNEQIYQAIMSGKEILGGEGSLGEVNFDLQRYSPWRPSAVVARTYPGQSNTIETNGQHYRYFNPHDMAANLTHEWIHLMGFYHSGANDLDSVPYAVGKIVRELADLYLKQGFLD